ncbi:unnamed protein product [Rotaria sp. Silwood1]|nr:unnamed protein product [Rotaria sp. Silwood1]
MDAVQQFTAQSGIHVPETFVISGASKRGWTTWTSAAVDSKRIIGAVPIVMDLVNLQISLNGWTFALKDFYALNIFRSLDTNNFTRMAEIIDPYNYFNRYKTIKTLQIQTTGDEFFLLDNEICRLS